MDLKNNNISVGEIISNSRAKEILRKNFPELMNPYILQYAQDKPLSEILKLAVGIFAHSQIQNVIKELEVIQQ